MCNKICHGCPFEFSDYSEQIQNYGCLPEPLEILQMRKKSGKTWACHSDITKPCVGAIQYAKENGQPYKIIDSVLVTESDDWGKYL